MYIFNKNNRPQLALAGLRITVGIMFLLAAYPKLSAGTGWSERMLGFINFQQNTPEWYSQLLDSIVVANAGLFGFLTAYGELAVGQGGS